MTFKWSEHVQELLVTHAEVGGDEEVCGFITTDGCVHMAKNIAPDNAREVTFYINPYDQFLAEVEHDAEVVAVYHSHPHNEPRPSQMDLDFAANHPEWLQVIIGREHTEWRIRSYDAQGEPCTFLP